MKWTHPGHQLDQLGERYLKVKNLYIYGIDEKAKKAYDFLQWLGVADEFDLSFVLDITVLNKERVDAFCGKRVIAFQTELCDRLRRAPEESAVALPWIAQSAEREILEKIGINNIFYLLNSNNRRDNFIQNFVCIWLMYKHGKLLSHWTNFLTTLKCNLNCHCCLNFNEYLDHPKDVSFEDFKDHMDTVLSKFDYLYSLHFTGGEPMVVKELPRFLRYIEENYKNRIFEIFIITNGTIVPSEEILSAVRSLNGHFFLDDYPAVPNSKVEEIKQLLSEQNVGYVVNSPQYWFDLDTENTDNSGFSDEELERHKDNCNSYLQEFAEKRIYACCYQQYAHRAGIGEVSPEDFIEIETASKMEILEFRQGYTRRGYVDFCKRCKGIGPDAKRVAPAVQTPRVRKSGAQRQPEPEVKMKDVVSVCVPIYNTEKYLARCVNSILAQTYRNLEIVLVDDGSTDSSGLICDDYARLDSRVVVVHKENGGEASARNAGLSAANGDYVMFIDSDDEYLPNAVEWLLSAVKTDAVDLVIGGYLERRGQTERFATGHQRRYSAKEAAHAYLTSECHDGAGYILSTVNAKLFRSELIRSHGISFDERFVVGNDSVFICEYLKHTRVVHDIFAPIYVYYKFQPSERIQGMAWFYPDAFFLFAYVADRMIKIAQPDQIELEQFVVKQYKDLLYGLLNATANKDYFKDGLMPYLTSFCNEIDLLQLGAKMDLTTDCIKKEEGALPIKLISYLIVHKRFSELYEMLSALGRARKMVPFKGGQVRQMLQIRQLSAEDHTDSSYSLGFVDDQLFVEQINDLVAAVTAAQRRIESGEAQLAAQKSAISRYETQISGYEGEIEAQKSAIERFEAQIRAYQIEINYYAESKSWRITKPFRAIMRRLRK